MDEIAELTGETPAIVQGTCSFYTMFKRRPCGRLLVSVCTNVTCLVTGGPGDPRAPRDEVRARRRGRRRRGRVPRRVRRRAGDAGELRVPRACSRRSSAEDDRRGVQARRLRARTISGSPSGARRDVRDVEETPHRHASGCYERPDDSWTIDGALAAGCYDVLRDVLAAGDPADDAGAGREVRACAAAAARTSRAARSGRSSRRACSRATSS